MANTVYLSKDEFDSMLNIEAVKDSFKYYTAASNILRREVPNANSSLLKFFTYQGITYIEEEEQ